MFGDKVVGFLEHIVSLLEENGGRSKTCFCAVILKYNFSLFIGERARGLICNFFLRSIYA